MFAAVVTAAGVAMASTGTKVGRGDSAEDYYEYVYEYEYEYAYEYENTVFDRFGLVQIVDDVVECGNTNAALPQQPGSVVQA